MKHKIHLRLILLSSYIKYLFSKKRNIKIRIISTKKWKNNVSDDVYIIKYLRSMGINSKIISYEDKIYEKNSIYLIKSVWGYQDNLNNFKEYLTNIKNNGNIIINPYNIVMNNYDKEKQYNLFIKYNIPHINSYFLDNDKDINKKILDKVKDKKYVIKPSISGSGNNTYIYNKDMDVYNIYHNITKESKIILQEYIDGVSLGEISLIYINHKLLYGVKRYPKVFTDKYSVKEIDIKDKDILSIGDKINSLEEYKDIFYLRIDLIKKDNKYLCIEIEALDPDIFLTTLNNKDKKISIYCNSLLEYIDKHK